MLTLFAYLNPHFFCLEEANIYQVYINQTLKDFEDQNSRLISLTSHAHHHLISALYHAPTAPKTHAQTASVQPLNLRLKNPYFIPQTSA